MRSVDFYALTLFNMQNTFTNQIKWKFYEKQIFAHKILIKIAREKGYAHILLYISSTVYILVLHTSLIHFNIRKIQGKY